MSYFNPNAPAIDPVSKILIINDEKDVCKTYSFDELVEFCHLLAKRDKVNNIRESLHLQVGPKTSTPPTDIYRNTNNASQGDFIQMIIQNSVPEPKDQKIELPPAKGDDEIGLLVDLSSSSGSSASDGSSLEGFIVHQRHKHQNSQSHLLSSVTSIEPPLSSLVNSSNNEDNQDINDELKMKELEEKEKAEEEELKKCNNNAENNRKERTFEDITREQNASNSSLNNINNLSSSSNNINLSWNGEELENKVYWIDMEGLGSDDILKICKIFGVHHLTSDDIINNESTEKSDQYYNYLFVSTSEVSYSSYNELCQTQISMVIFKSFILVFHSEPLDCFDTVMKSFRYFDGTKIPSSNWVMTSFFDSINELFTNLAEHLMHEVYVLDDFSLRDDLAQNEHYVRLGRAIRKATNLLSWLFIRNDTISSLLRNEIGEETKRYLRNIKDRVLRIQQKIKLAEELLENINTVYISKQSLVLNEESHALNISMSRFATLTLIFMPLTLITGIFGMNVRVPGMIGYYEGDFGYEFFLSIMLFSFVWISGMGFYFKRLGWL